MMILRRKKKQKKEKKLQEAQQQAAFLASLQASGSQAPAYINSTSGLRRPPSAMSVPAISTFNERDLYEDEEVSGSDPDTEIMDPLDSFQHQNGELLSVQHSQQQQENSPPHTLQYSQAQSSTMPASSSMQNLSKDILYRKPPLTQPAFLMQQTSVPATTVTVESQPVMQQQPNLYSQQIQQVQQAQQIQQAQQVQQAQQIQQAQQLQQLQHQVQQLQQVQMSPRLRTAATSGNNTLRKNREPKKIPPEKAELIATAISLGLGRGINANDKMPWLNKTPFQVRRVHTSIVETNEGGILVNYNHEVQSIAEVEEQFLGSVNPPESTVTIHIEDELDRNVSSTRRIIGRRVVNRSIGFQADFEEKYRDGEAVKLSKESFLVPKDPAEVVYNTQESSQTFEERVSQWILHRLVRKCNIALHKHDDSPIEQLAKLIQTKAAPSIENEIKNGCHDLIQSLRITHYVSGIQLGAAEYKIMSDGQYHKKMASKGAFGVDTLVSDVPEKKKKQSKKEAMKCSQLRHVGKITDDHVAKGTQDEVVLQVLVQPITRLVKLPVLKSALRAALEKHMEGTPSSEGGPFVIKCTGRDLYLTVNKFNNYEVEGTDIPTEASLFYFQTTDDGGNPFEFHIAYYGEDADPNDQTTESSSICRYLEAPLNAQGRCPGPLLMKHSVKVKNTRFTLRSRLSKKSNKSHLEEWIAGEDAFYVACATKKYQHGSYLAVKNIKNTAGELLGKHFFMTCCDPSIHNHNGENSFMLFQLYTKEAILSKGFGTETPGKLPVMRQAAEVETKSMNGHAPLLTNAT